jgi:hypothetical protein
MSLQTRKNSKKFSTHIEQIKSVYKSHPSLYKPRWTSEPTMIKQSTKPEPEATAHPESPWSATQERASTTTQPTWPRTRKSRLSILPKVNNKGNKVKDNTDIFTHKNFHTRFAANTNSLFTTVLGIIQEHNSLLKELNTLYIKTNIQIKILIDKNNSL